MTRSRLYRDGNLVEEDFPPEQVSNHLQDPACVVWLDVAPDADGLATISEELGLDRHAVEDAVDGSQRPKLDRYEGHSFLTVYTTAVDQETRRLVTGEVAAFITRQALVTVRRTDDAFLENLLARWDNEGDLLKHGVPALLHGLLDLVVDTHFDTVEMLDDQIEELEDLLFAGTAISEGDRELQRRTFELRRSLVVLRRLALPMREVLNNVIHRATELSDGAMLPYYQDVYDHVLRVSESTEGLRDMVTTIFETNLSMADHSLNVVVKKLTGWAAIIAVPTAVTGFYGQNVPYPGFAHWSGFVVSTALWVGLSGSLYVGLRRKDWI